MEATEDRPEPEFKRTESETRREIEFEKSDRIEVIVEANDLIEHLSRKDIEPAMMGSMREVEWSHAETSCYNAALKFLQAEFEKGPKLGEHWDKVHEKKQNIDYQD